jgi:hypothetical protein
MRFRASLFLALAIGLAGAAQAKEPARLDGSADAVFEKSFARLVRSLKTPERRTLALGLFGALLKHECLAPDAVVRLTFLPVEPRDGKAIRPCREHLHGMSYPEILKAGQPPASTPDPELPDNASKPAQLRGATSNSVAFDSHLRSY